MNPQLSLFRGSYAPDPVGSRHLEDILRAIQRGDYRASIERIRHLRSARGEEAYRTAKVHLDAVTFGGTFAPTRAKKNLEQHSAICHGDLDHLPNLEEVKAQLCGDPFTLYCFTSISAHGLKVGLPIPAVQDDNTYKRYWQTIADYYRETYGLIWDPSGQDVCRLCYLSWDSGLYYARDAQLWEKAIAPELISDPPFDPYRYDQSAWGGDRRGHYGQRALDTAVRLLDASTDGNRHRSRCKAAYLLGGYVAGHILNESETLAAIKPVVQRNTKHFHPSWRTFRSCLKAGMAAAISFAALERERQAWIDAHGYGIRTYSPASPWPLPTVEAEEMARWLR